ncbi:MAG: filamentous hemagglutinin N-terminal domain-containing protein [Leptolyngbya sp. SIOISBB]|nr:filamentous hemagglutinin N-terminal domain-containing protein [Leptolyngbya sp. SIOISBB]
MKLGQWITAIALSTSGGLLLGSATQASPIVPQPGSSTQAPQMGNEFTITGGVTSADGQSLFHAFEQLGLSQGQVATFLAQPEVQSILGSVVGGEASYIDGLLRVAGSSADLYLINPAGILFGPNAQLDLAGSFAATTANGILFDEAIFNVLSGDDFSQVSGAPTGFVFAIDEAGAVVNAADLQVAAGQSITLIGGQVISTGSVTAPGGEITIAAIPEANLVRISHPDMVLNLEVTTLPEGAITNGTSLTPLSLPDLLAGTPETLATGLSVNPDGTIALTNSDIPVVPVAGSAIASGNVDVSGVSGGDVAVVGDRVALLNTTVNASGIEGGGAVRIGGDLQGQPTLPGSTLTYVDGESIIAANAGETGDGGQVILWSDGTTVFAGEIVTHGGTNTGDGGFVEVSGAQTLVYDGDVSAISPNGQVGTLLLDPVDITIRNGTNDGDDSDASAIVLTEFNIAAADPIPTILYESELENSPGNVNLAIRASNNITIEDLADNALTFQTDGVAPGSITFEAGGAWQMLDPNDTIEAPRRSLTITANTITAGTLDTSDSNQGGDISLTATGAIATGDLLSFGDSMSGGSGNITVVGANFTAGRISAGSGFSTASRVELTATTGDIIVDTISAGNGGLEIEAAQRFQARDTFDVFVRIALDSSTDAELIAFLMRGNPQPLIDAGLVDPADFNDQVFITFPASIFVSPEGGTGEIVIRHGGQATTFTAPGITIQGSGALPDQQFVIGPNDDHTIDINPAIPVANFTGFTTLYPPGTFPANVNGTTGAILRGQGDATLVTSFQNQPFVPMPVTPGTGTPSTGGSSTGGGTPPIAPTFEFESATLENLSPDESEAVAEPVSETEAATLEASEAEACEAAIANRAANAVEIASTCPASDSTDAAN